MEELLRQLIEQNNQLFEEIKALKQQNQLLQQQIAELKENQTKAFKQMFESTIKEELAQLIEMQIDKYLDKIEYKQDATIENQHEIAEFLKLLRKELVSHIKESKESDKELLDKGDKILEVLDDIGNAVVNTQESILKSNNDWGANILENLGKLGIGITGLAKRIDNASEYVRENNDMTYKAVKDLENTIHRMSW